MLGIEPKPFRMRNEHSTSELHPPIHFTAQICYFSLYAIAATRSLGVMWFKYVNVWNVSCVASENRLFHDLIKSIVLV